MVITMKDINVVIFDMDGLMFDTEAVCFKAMKAVLADHGYTMTKEIYTKLVGSNGEYVRQVLKQTYGDDYPAEMLSRLTGQKMMADIDENGLPIKPGLYELIAYLKSKNIKMYLASSTKRARVCHYLEMAHLTDTFDGMICGDEVTRTKPDPQIFEIALQKSGETSDHALILEDSHNGIIAASRAHIPVLCIPDMKYHDKSIMDLCVAVKETLNDVIDYLEA